LDRLNIDISETIFPRASSHINEQIEIIKKLEAKGYVYKISDGIYFKELSALLVLKLLLKG